MRSLLARILHRAKVTTAISQRDLVKPQTLRLWHTYIGLCIAPSLLFFALTGAIQLFGLHEADGQYHPFTIVEKLGMLHKDQVFRLKHPKTAPQPATAPAGAAEKDEDELPLPTLILKVYFLITAIGLVASTLLGAWMALSFSQRSRTQWLALVAGAAIPVALVLLTV
jgi:hypothetical protein